MARTRSRSAVKTDVIVVGGGHAGLSLAASLGAAGIGVVCLERGDFAAKRAMKSDGRTLALSFRSMQHLRQNGVAAFMEKEACPILDIRVADQDSPHYLDFHHQEVGMDPFGWIIENPLFNRALEKRVKQLKSVKVLSGASVQKIERDTEKACVILEDGRAFEGQLVIGADGRKSLCRHLAEIPVYGWSYHQTATVCTIEHSKPHNNVAIEHFQPGGPFATLPMTHQRSSIVWTEKTEVAETLMKLDEETFTQMLQERVEPYLGKVKLTGPRFSYPLTLQHAETYIAPRLALVGDAAHGIHPISGQGFNLGMGDVEVLAEELIRAARLGLDLGQRDLLRRYEKRRKFENGNMVLMTDVLDRLFSNSIPPVQAARRWGLSAVQHMPRLRHFFMRTAMGSKTKSAA